MCVCLVPGGVKAVNQARRLMGRTARERQQDKGKKEESEGRLCGEERRDDGTDGQRATEASGERTQQRREQWTEGGGGGVCTSLGGSLKVCFHGNQGQGGRCAGCELDPLVVWGLENTHMHTHS